MAECMPFPAGEMQYHPVPHPRIEYNGLLEYHHMTPQEDIVGEKVITTVEYDPIIRPKFDNAETATTVSSRKVMQKQKQKQQASRGGKNGHKGDKKIDYSAATDSETYDEPTKPTPEYESNCGNKDSDGYGGDDSGKSCPESQGPDAGSKETYKPTEDLMKGMMMIQASRINMLLKRLTGQQELLDKIHKKVNDLDSKITMIAVMSQAEDVTGMTGGKGYGKPKEEELKYEEPTAVPVKKAKKEYEGKKARMKESYESAKDAAYEKDEKEGDSGTGYPVESEEAADDEGSGNSDVCSKCNLQKYVNKKIKKKNKMKTARTEYEATAADDESERIFISESE